MIINDTINLHNVGQTKSYKGGLMLLRYPSNVISKMGYGPNIKGKTKLFVILIISALVLQISEKEKSKEFVLNFINAKWNIFIVLVINLFCGVLLCLLIQEYHFMKL